MTDQGNRPVNGSQNRAISRAPHSDEQYPRALVWFLLGILMVAG